MYDDEDHTCYCCVCGAVLPDMDATCIECIIRQETAEAEESFIEEYNQRPDVQYGWVQQDLIDSYRAER